MRSQTSATPPAMAPLQPVFHRLPRTPTLCAGIAASCSTAWAAPTGVASIAFESPLSWGGLLGLGAMEYVVGDDFNTSLFVAAALTATSGTHGTRRRAPTRTTSPHNVWAAASTAAAPTIMAGFTYQSHHSPVAKRTKP